MKTINIRVNEKTNAGKALLSVVEALNGQDGVEANLENFKYKKKNTGIYNPEFVKEILQRHRDRKRINRNTILDPKNIWESIK